MIQLLKFLLFVATTLALTGCGGQDTETAPPPAPEQTTQSQPEGPQRAEPADQPPPARASASETEDDSEAATRARSQRSQLRAGRDGESGWWNDDSLAEELGLNPEQRATLLEAREALHSAQLEGRARLRELRGQTEAQGDADRLAELQSSIGSVRERIEEAEGRWQEAVRATLQPEQYRQIQDLIGREDQPVSQPQAPPS